MSDISHNLVLVLLILALFPGVSLTLCCFVVYSTRRFVLCLTLCDIVLVFFSPFSIAITSLGEERANLSIFRTFVRFVLIWICRFSLPLGVWEGLQFVIVELPGLFSYAFLFYEAICFMSCLVLFCSCVFSPFSIAITSLGEERELVLVLFGRLFDLRLFGFVY